MRAPAGGGVSGRSVRSAYASEVADIATPVDAEAVVIGNAAERPRTGRPEVTAHMPADMAAVTRLFDVVAGLLRAEAEVLRR